MILFAETSAFSWVGGVLIGMMGGIGGTLLWWQVSTAADVGSVENRIEQHRKR